MNDIRLSESQIRVLMTLEQEGELSYEDLAEKSGLSYDGVRGRVSELKKAGFNIEKIKEGNTTLIKYEGENKTPTRSKLVTFGDLVGNKTKSLDDFYGVLEVLERARTAKPAFKKKKMPIAKEKCGVLLLSDLHIGEIIKENGNIVFNTEVAETRLQELTERTIENMKDKNLEYIYIALLGDIIDGDAVYRNHVFNIEKAAIEQVKDAVSILSNMFKMFLKEGFTVEAGCVRGNHGITNYKNLEQDNWDNVVYDMLNLVFRDVENIHINHYADQQAKVKVLDRHLVLYHGGDLGDQSKTSSGLKIFRGMCGMHKLDDGDMIVIGDRHSFGVELDQDKLLVRNGSLPSASEYAIKMNLYGTPMQVFMVFEEGVKYPNIIPIEFTE